MNYVSTTLKKCKKLKKIFGQKGGVLLEMDFFTLKLWKFESPARGGVCSSRKSEPCKKQRFG